MTTRRRWRHPPSVNDILIALGACAVLEGRTDVAGLESLVDDELVRWARERSGAERAVQHHRPALPARLS